MSKTRFLLSILISFLSMFAFTPAYVLAADTYQITTTPTRIYTGKAGAFTVTVKTSGDFSTGSVYYRYAIFNDVTGEMIPQNPIASGQPDGWRTSPVDKQTINAVVGITAVTRPGTWIFKIWPDGSASSNTIATKSISIEQPGGRIPGIQAVQSPIQTDIKTQNVPLVLTNVNENNDYIVWWNGDADPHLPRAPSQCFSKDYIKNYIDANRDSWRNQLPINLGPGGKRDRFTTPDTNYVCMDLHACSNQADLLMGNITCSFKAQIDFRNGKQLPPPPTPTTTVAVPTTAKVGDRIQVRWNDLAGPRELDYIGFFKAGADDSLGSGSWFYLASCQPPPPIPDTLPPSSGTCDFDIPASLSVNPDGDTYEFRLFSHVYENSGQSIKLAVSNSIQISPPEPLTSTGPRPSIGPPINTSPTPSYAPGTLTKAGGEDCDTTTSSKGAAIKTTIGCIHTNPPELIKDFLAFGTGISGGLAFLMMILGAFQMLTSAGNPETLNAGRDRLTSAVIGLLFIIFAVLLLQIIGVDILKIPGFKI